MIKSHDRLPPISATLVDADSAAVNLTGTTVSFIMATVGTLTIKVNQPAIIVVPSEGTVRYDWAAIDTAVAGEYLAEWEVTYPDGRQQTFPSTGYNTVSITADLDGA